MGGERLFHFIDWLNMEVQMTEGKALMENVLVDHCFWQILCIKMETLDIPFFLTNTPYIKMDTLEIPNPSKLHSRFNGSW